ncbi:MAG: zinc ABC transporter substrate-binding protein [Chlamydiales bacterium]|jgi:zinc transport system substrate-binding protein|nr:zinc ABC transporter substrate-binding protein [Chlamydiales bacterium]
MRFRLLIGFFYVIPVLGYPQTPVVLVSIPPYLYFVKKIAENTVLAESLIPSGKNPHLYEPTYKQVQLQKQAVLWLKLGEKADQKAQRVFQEMKNPPLIIDLTEGLALLSYKDTKDPCCDHSTKDLHIWLSPKMAQIQAKKIAQTLIHLFPIHTELYQNNLTSLLKELEQVDEKLATMLENKQGKTILVSHPAFAYFCKDYKLIQLSLEEEGKDCLPKYIPQLLHKIQTLGINGIIIEPQHSSKAAKLIAQNLKIPIYNINPYSEDYIENLKQMAEVVKTITHD